MASITPEEKAFVSLMLSRLATDAEVPVDPSTAEAQAEYDRVDAEHEAKYGESAEDLFGRL